MEALIDQFKIRLSSEMKKYSKNKQGLDRLKQKFLQGIRLLKDVVDADEKKLKASNGITEMLRNKARKKEKKSIDYWTDVIKDNLEDLRKSLLKVEEESKYQVSEDSDDDSDEDNDEVDDNNEERMRTFSTSLSPVIRTDLPPQVKQVFMDIINTHLEQISNYTSDFSVKISEISLLFSEKSFVSTGNKFELTSQSRNSIAHILPHGYKQGDIAVPNLLDAQLSKNSIYVQL